LKLTTLVRSQDPLRDQDPCGQERSHDQRVDYKTFLIEDAWRSATSVFEPIKRISVADCVVHGMSLSDVRAPTFPDRHLSASASPARLLHYADRYDAQPQRCKRLRVTRRLRSQRHSAPASANPIRSRSCAHFMAQWYPGCTLICLGRKVNRVGCSSQR
jgi:hypothetical protein